MLKTERMHLATIIIVFLCSGERGHVAALLTLTENNGNNDEQYVELIFSPTDEKTPTVMGFSQ